MRPTAPVFPRSTRRSSILSRLSGRRSEPFIKNATVVLGRLASAVEPGVFHPPFVVRAVDPCGDALDLRIGAGRLARVKDDRPTGVFRQPPLDLPDKFAAPIEITRDGLLVDQLVGPGITIAGVVALGPAIIILVEHLVGIVEPGFGDG